jgi:trehalose 6-phosphate synthase/phosphatase
MTPSAEISNPFAKLSSTAATLAGAAKSIIEQVNPVPPSSPPPRRHQATHDGKAPARIQRRSSKSSTRRAASDVGPWHIEPNSRCNGGLKNAIDSVDSKLHDTLWVGSLGTSTDGFSDALRSDITRKMGRDYNSAPVWISDAEFESCYDEFCHQVCH